MSHPLRQTDSEAGKQSGSSKASRQADRQTALGGLFLIGYAVKFVTARWQPVRSREARIPRNSEQGSEAW